MKKDEFKRKLQALNLPPETAEHLSVIFDELPSVFARSAVPRLIPGVCPTAGYLANLDSLNMGPPSFELNGRRCYSKAPFLLWLAGRRSFKGKNSEKQRGLNQVKG